MEPIYGAGERKSWQVLTSAHLQLIAMVTMAIDHIGYLLLPQVGFLRVIGRLAFPLYCLMVAEGFIHTSDRQKYFGRLALFAVISTAPYAVFTGASALLEAGFSGQALAAALREELLGNVIFELLLSFAALWAVSKGKWGLLAIPAALALAELLDLMYGWYGIAMILWFYFFRERRGLQAAGVAALTLLFCFATVLGVYLPYLDTVPLGRLLALSLEQTFRYVQIAAVFAAAPVLLYNGERGRRLPRYAGYVFYPAHLLLLAGIFFLHGGAW